MATASRRVEPVGGDMMQPGKLAHLDQLFFAGMIRRYVIGGVCKMCGFGHGRGSIPVHGLRDSCHTSGGEG